MWTLYSGYISTLWFSCVSGEHIVIYDDNDDGNDDKPATADSDSVVVGPSLNSSELLSLPEELDTIPLEELTLPDEDPLDIVIAFNHFFVVFFLILIYNVTLIVVDLQDLRIEIDFVEINL